MQATNHNKRILGVFSLAMMAVAAIINLRGLPLMASEGFSAVFFYVLAALLFLIPSGLVCTELARVFPQAGGLYIWVRETLGNRTGFLAIWLEWINNVISFPASLSFMAATLAYVIMPHNNQNLVENKLYIFAVTLIILWSTTLFNLLGIKASSRLNIVGALAGTLIPGAIIIVLGGFWLASGHAPQISFSFAQLFPDLKISNFAFFAGVLSGYSGMQLIAFHITNVNNPRRDFPLAIFLAVILILCTTILASLAIAIVVPKTQLSLVSGLMAGFTGFFQAFQLQWALPILALLIFLGAVSTLSAWLLGPARGLAVAAQNGHFFKFFAGENSKGAPTRILILQAILASIFASIFLFTPNASTAFWILLDLSSQSTLLMYVLVFSAAIALRYKHNPVAKSFNLMAPLAGISVCLMALIMSFVPPAALHVTNVWYYESILIVSNLVYIGIPLLFIRRVNSMPQMTLDANV